jgi:hypothetical protein
VGARRRACLGSWDRARTSECHRNAPLRPLRAVHIYVCSCVHATGAFPAVVLLCVRRMVARVCLSWLAARTHALLLLLLLLMMMMMTIARGVNINRALSRRLGWRLAQEMSGLPSLCCSR